MVRIVWWLWSCFVGFSIQCHREPVRVLWQAEVNREIEWRSDKRSSMTSSGQAEVRRECDENSSVSVRCWPCGMLFSRTTAVSSIPCCLGTSASHSLWNNELRNLVRMGWNEDEKSVERQSKPKEDLEKEDAYQRETFLLSSYIYNTPNNPILREPSIARTLDNRAPTTECCIERAWVPY